MKKPNRTQEFINLVTGVVVIIFSSIFTLQGQTISQTFTTPGTATFIVPAGVTSLTVESWGGGGGGGFGRSTNGAAGGGGGGGGYTLSTIAVTPGASISYTVGAGGAGGTSGGVLATPGDQTIFNSGSPVIAGGGGRGVSVITNTSGAGGTGGTGGTFIGGNGAAGIAGTGGASGAGGGGGGGSGGTGSDGNPGSGLTGGAAVAGGGAGGNGARNTNGEAGTEPGGGGAGGHKNNTNRSGGNGAAGQMRISWTQPEFFYTGSGEPSVTTNWETVGGHNPNSFTTNNQTFTIQNGRTAIATNVWAISGTGTLLKIQSGGTLTENSAITLAAATTLQVDNGGRLNHNVNSLTIFGGTESFGSTSTIDYGFAGAQTVLAATYGNLTLSGSGAKTTTGATVNGILSMEGSATATGTAPSYGANATLRYKGSAPQFTGSEIAATFSGLGGVIIDNPLGVTLSANATVSSLMTMTAGNINTGNFILTLSNGLATSLVHTSGTIIGKFRRTVTTTILTDYIFPVGTSAFHRPAIMRFSSITSGTDITAEFLATPPFGFIPYTDGAVTLNSIFTDGYWRFSSSGTPTVNYTLTLTADDFTSFLINSNTRISGRDNTNSAWRALGTHGTQSGDDISRTSITNINTTSFDFALASECTAVSMSYSFEKDITIDYTMVAGGSDLYSFPVLINLTGQDFLKTSPAGPIMNSSGYDILFTDVDHNKLDHQIEYFDGTTGALIAWVRIPTLSASANTVIKMLYGNPQVITDPSVVSVWDSHYKGVWHLNNSSLNDYTLNDKSGTSYNSPTYPAGVISNSLGLNGTNQYVEVINAPNTNFAGNITISAWVYMATGGRDQKIAGNQNNSSGGYKFGIYTNNKVEFEIRNSANTPSLNRDVAGGTVLNTGQWYYLAGMSSDVLDSIKTFVNGIPERPFKKTGTLGIASNDVTISKEPFAASFYFAGRFDELRISDRVRSDGWLRTEYNNQSSPSAFYSVGSAVSLTSLPSASICDGPITLPDAYPAGGTYSGNSYITGNIFTPPSPGTYSIVYTYVGPCGPVSIAKEIIITPVPPAPVAPNQSYCTGQIANLTATSGENIQWYSGGLLVSTANPYSTGITTPGTYNYTVKQSVNGCESAPASVSLTISAGTTIVTQPQPVSICTTGSGSFTIVATGYNLNYQWQEAGVNISNGGIYSGANTPTLTITNPGIAKNGLSYRCIITTTCGTSPVNSTGAVLTVTTAPVATFSYAGSPYCQTGTNPTPTFSGGGVAGTFSSTAGLVFVSTATGQVNLASSTPGTYTVTNSIAAAGGCGIITATSPITIIPDGVWTGVVNSDWNVAGNWSCLALPTVTSSVQIPNVVNKPTLGAGAVANVKDLTIDAGSSLTISGNTIKIAGAILNNGTFTVTSGTVELNGTLAQSVPANVFAANTVRNLIINNSAGVSLGGPLDVTGILTTTNGELATGGYLTLISDATGTALISGSGAGSVTGDVTMQRYLTSGYGYKYFSSPFTTTTVDEFSNELITAIYRYDENRLIGGTIPASGWVDHNLPANPLNTLNGYSVNFGSNPASITVDLTGEVNNGALSLPVFNNNQIYTQGFNLVGNPYPSPIDWDLVKFLNTNVDNAIYYYKAGITDEWSGTYSSYVGGFSSDGLATNVIPSMQGFFIRVSTGTYPVAGTLSMNNSVRLTDLTHGFLKSSRKGSESLIRLTAAFSADTAMSDPLVVYMSDKATIDFDSESDALKLYNTAYDVPSFYSVGNDGSRLSVNGMPFSQQDSMIIPLGLMTDVDGYVSFRIKHREGVFSTGKVYMFDLLTGTTTELKSGIEYKTYLAADHYQGRFFLKLEDLTTSVADEPVGPEYFSAYYSKGVLKAEVDGIVGNSGTVMITSLTGQSLYIWKVHENGYHEFMPTLSSGIYIVTYTSGNIRISKRLFIY